MGGCCSASSASNQVVDSSTQKEATLASDSDGGTAGQGKDGVAAVDASKPSKSPKTRTALPKSKIRKRSSKLSNSDLLNTPDPNTNGSTHGGILVSFNPQNVHILVCDDDRSSRTLTKWLLEKKYHVTTCLDGNEAIIVLKQSAQEGRVDDFNVVLTDAEMQTDNGLKLLDFVKNNEHTTHLPVILMSADSTPQAMDRCIRRGGSDFISKPITKQVLLKTVQLTCETELEINNTRLVRNQGDQYKTELIAMEKKAKQKGMIKGLISPYPSQSKAGSSKFDFVQAAHSRASSRRVSLSQNSAENHDSNSSRRSFNSLTRADRAKNAIVVCIDQDTSVTNKAKYWLEQLPFVEVVTFATGDLALPFIKTCLGEGGRVDLVMCAVGKIDEEKNVSDKSGLHLLDALTRDKDTKGIPVVLVGNISPLEMTEAVRHGCDTFLKKPITKDLTVKKAASLLQNMAQRRKTSLLFDRAQKYKELLEKMRKSQEASNNNTPELKDKNADVDQPSSGNLGNRTLSLTIEEETTHDPIMVLSQVSQESISPHNASTMTTSSEDGP